MRKGRVRFDYEIPEPRLDEWFSQVMGRMFYRRVPKPEFRDTVGGYIVTPRLLRGEEGDEDEWNGESNK